MKTIREWLEELPEPYRTQAIDNYENPECNMYKRGDWTEPEKKQESLVDAIYDAFIWLRTPEGFQYWVDFKNTLTD